MTIDHLILAFICWGALMACSFVALYPVLSPGWRRTWIGWAMLVSSTSVMLLLGLAVAGRVFGREFLAYDYVALVIVFLVALGATLKLTALLSAKFRAAITDDNA